MRSNIEGARIRDSVFYDRCRKGTLSVVLAATFTVNRSMPSVIFLDPDSAGREVDLPLATTTGNKGLEFYIVNSGTVAATITVKDSLGSTTFGTIGKGEVGWFVCDGTTWWALTQADTTDQAITGTLTVTGAAVMNSTFAVASAATLSSTLGVAKAVTLSSTVGVASAATFSSTLAVASDVTISSTLTVLGSAALSSGGLIGSAAANTIGFYGATKVSQRANSIQISSNVAVSASFGATQLSAIQEVMNTLTGLGLWKGAA